MDIKKGKNSQFVGEITIRASPPIYIEVLTWGWKRRQWIDLVFTVYNFFNLKISLIKKILEKSIADFISRSWLSQGRLYNPAVNN